jgi:LmbE family N-acetylglucosaminyl deacetylase
MKYNLRAILLVGAAALLIAPAISHAANELPAQDVTALSRSASKEDGRAVKRTRDGKLETYAEYGAEEAFSLTWEAGAGVRTAYVKWYALPEYAILVQSDENGVELSRETIDAPIYNDCYSILPEARAFSLSCEAGLRIAEVTLFSEGPLPEEIHAWQPPLTKADLLVVSAHCDDELIFFGGTIPYYAGERGLAVQVVYMANGDRARVDEALNGLWHAGVRHSPVFLPLKDVYTESLKRMLLNWGEEETTGLLVELIRSFQPEVIVSHDLDGEYGHGAHMATAHCLLRAVPEASLDTAFPDSAGRYGTWQTQKLYLHLYPAQQITMDWNLPLTAFGGKSALEVANEAYHMHVSQLQYHSNVYGDGEYSSLEYGLAFTAVGADEAKDDFFEHIDPARLSDYIAPTPEPTAKPTSTPLATAAPAQQTAETKKPPMVKSEDLMALRGITIVAFVILAAGAMIALKLRQDNNQKR